jgi:hypothetical protein
VGSIDGGKLVRVQQACNRGGSPSHCGEGRLPEDKEAMLVVIDPYLALPQGEEILFRLGRRGGALRSLAEFNDLVMRYRLQSAISRLSSETGGDLEKLITESGDQHI